MSLRPPAFRLVLGSSLSRTAVKIVKPVTHLGLSHVRLLLCGGKACREALFIESDAAVCRR